MQFWICSLQGSVSTFQVLLFRLFLQKNVRNADFSLKMRNLIWLQFGITYKECLFHPLSSVREAAISAVNSGMQVARELGAFFYLFRPGSLNPDGAWTSHKDNHLPESMDRLIETLKPIAENAERERLTLVMETHAISIMDSPETCREVVERVGSDRLTHC